MVLITSCTMRSQCNVLSHQRLAICLLAVLMTCLLLLKGRQAGDTSGLAALSLLESTETMILISGDVRYPGVYTCSDKKMTSSVIEMAKPLCGGVVAALDSQHTVLPTASYELSIACIGHENKPVVKITPMKTAQRITLGIPLDINQVTEADLELLPGIGPVLAGNIVRYRQKYGKIRDLKQLLLVEGIGNSKLDRLSHYFKDPKQQNKLLP